jgi:hypothetical protein
VGSYCSCCYSYVTLFQKEKMALKTKHNNK